MASKEHAHLSSGQKRAIDIQINQGATKQQLAKKYGVSKTIIENVLTRKGEATMTARKPSSDDDKPAKKTDPEPQPGEQPSEQPPSYDDADQPPPWAPQY